MHLDLIKDLHNAVISVFEDVIDAARDVAHFFVSFFDDAAADAVDRRVAVNSSRRTNADVVVVLVGRIVGLAESHFDQVGIVEERSRNRAVHFHRPIDRLKLQDRRILIVLFGLSPDKLNKVKQYRIVIEDADTFIRIHDVG